MGLTCALLAVVLWGGETKPADSGAAKAARPPRGAGEAAVKAGPKKPYEMDLEELRDYQRYTYVPGGRDPLTFRTRRETRRPEETPATVGPKGVTKVTDVNKMQEALRLVIGELACRLLSQDYESAVEMAKKFHEEVEKTWAKKPTESDLYDLWAVFLTHERTAKRLLQVRQIADEFNSLNLEVNGVQWSARGCAALINDKFYEPGDAVEVKVKDKAQVTVESVDEAGVVFGYKGQRFRKTVGEATVPTEKRGR
ncbi:MAG: hypothetical protein N3A66_02035 [Planctomycetota bacterium]|nr:hypothetical protein [Planctomycetota bacterium]